MLQLMVNTGPLRRRWDNLVNVNTGRTLSLAPGEEAEVDVPPDFEDPYLQPVPAKGARLKARPHPHDSSALPEEPAETAPPEEPTPPAPENKE